MTARAREPSAAADPWFGDALSGPDGMAEPAPTMPVLDVYPDALSSAMPDVQPQFVRPRVATTGVSVAMVGPDADPVGAQPVGALPGSAQPLGARPAERVSAQQAPRQPQGARPTPRAVTGAKRAPVPGSRLDELRGSVAARAAAGDPAARSILAAQEARTAAQRQAQNRSASVGGPRPPQGRQPAQPRPTVAPRGVGHQQPAPPLPRYRPYTAPQHDQYMPAPAPERGRSSATPAAVQPAAAPSQGASMQRLRDQARRTGARNRTSGNAVAVLVFIVIVVFASGLGGRVIELLTELFQR